MHRLVEEEDDSLGLSSRVRWRESDAPASAVASVLGAPRTQGEARRDQEVGDTELGQACRTAIDCIGPEERAGGAEVWTPRGELLPHGLRSAAQLRELGGLFGVRAELEDPLELVECLLGRLGGDLAFVLRNKSNLARLQVVCNVCYKLHNGLQPMLKKEILFLHKK